MNCLNCSKPISPKKSEIKRGYGKFCSLSCSSTYAARNRKKEFNVHCSFCNKLFYKSPSKISRSRSGLHFCCRSHKDAAQRLGGISAIHPKHYGSSYRTRALQNLPLKCARCGYDESIVALAVHHKDGNHGNNALSNLQLLCMNCHAIEHWG